MSLKQKGTQLLTILLLTTNHFLGSPIFLSSQDSLKIDTNKLWFDKSNYLLVGGGLNYRNFNFTFKNNTANLIGWLNYSHIVDKLNYNVYNWKFFPSLNQTNASFFATTKYGKLSFNKAINPSNIINFSKMTSFDVSIPYKKLDFAFSYLKITGLNRTEPIYSKTTFLQDMVFNPISFTIEYKRYPRLNNHLLFVPKKMIVTISIVLSGMNLQITNPNDFIPALKFKNNNQADSVIQINGVYLQKFTSTGFYFGPKTEFLIPIVKNKNPYKPNILYLKGMFSYGLNSQRFEYKTITDTLNTKQFKENSKGFGTTSNLNISGQIIYDANVIVIGLGAGLNNQSYGKANVGSGSKDNDNHVLDKRINYNAFISYRIYAKKMYSKIETFKNKFKIN